MGASEAAADVVGPFVAVSVNAAAAAELLQRVVVGLQPLLHVVVAQLQRPLLDVVAAAVVADDESESLSDDIGCHDASAVEEQVAAAQRSMVVCRPCVEPSLAVAVRPSQPAKQKRHVLACSDAMAGQDAIDSVLGLAVWNQHHC